MVLTDPISSVRARVNWANVSKGGTAMLVGVTYLEGLQSGGGNCLNLVKRQDRWTVLPTRITMPPDELEQLMQERG